MDINKIDKAVELRDEFINLCSTSEKVGKAIDQPEKCVMQIRTPLLYHAGFSELDIPAELVRDEMKRALLKYKQYLENRIEELKKQIEEL